MVVLEIDPKFQSDPSNLDHIFVAGANGAEVPLSAIAHYRRELLAWQRRHFSKTSGHMPLLILGALVAMYIVLGVLYESLAHPLTIISTLPSAGPKARGPPPQGLTRRSASGLPPRQPLRRHPTSGL